MKNTKIKHLLLLLPLFLLGLILAGCSSSSTPSVPEKNNISSQQSSSNDNGKATYPNKWTDGVPAKYKGYYGRMTNAYGEKTLAPMYFLNKSVSFGVGDATVLDSVQYKQVSDTDYVLKGIDNHYDSSRPTFYVKISTKVKNGVTYIGTYVMSDQAQAQGKSDNSASSFAKTKALKDDGTYTIDWYKHYDSKAALLAAQNSPSSDTSSDTTSSSNKGSDDLKYTIKSSKGKTYKSKYTIDQMRQKFDLPYSKTTDEYGYETVKNGYDGDIVEDPIVHDGSPEESHAEGSKQLSGNYAIFYNKTYDGGNAMDHTLVNLETGAIEKDQA
ncbi:hypothetical protein [Companilactobacillus mishanensis]|uniref:Lipoprotein n=1 Tax=Companilactobacillus mishanensis TaxID=2486008 RepID=A0A5P0ZIT9_9LACO|nr:hypothetical protein [Companilactobacillus mishanensis]MQS53021.1 hypothetical protein [Companilactobacillus mishanensis]